ncbi:MAG: FG-GAP repeat protein [Deltaproteobacteria bacterium]|nr:FG-GAP repeat protein [Deltaproteobacteria bacterium]
MHRVLAVVLPAWLAAGCLTVPTPIAGPDAGGDFPPHGGTPLAISSAVVADLNGDRRDDVILVNSSGFDDQGFLVLLGRVGGIGTRYDAWQATPIALVPCPW